MLSNVHDAELVHWLFVDMNSYFASVEQPFTVALLLDVSGSTQSRLQSIRSAANTFISRLRPIDRLLLVSFDGKIYEIVEKK